MRSYRLRHRIGHRAVIERTNESSFRRHFHVARCPYGGHSGINGKYCVILRDLAQDGSYILRMDRLSVFSAFRKAAQRFFSFTVFFEAGFQMLVAFFPFQQRQDGLDCGP